MLRLWVSLLLLMPLATADPAGDPVNAALSGLTDAQKTVALKVLNEKKCPCGCTKGSIAQCRRTDSKCSTAPKLITQVVSLTRQEKTADDILRLINVTKPEKKPQLQSSMVPYRKDDPYKGPAVAKVTIIEFSDFQ